jgi:hypothetical protein
MKTIKTVFVIINLMVACQLMAATHYVGVGAQCNGANHHDTLALALFAAALNGSENDEVRLTNTVTYFGNGDGTNTLSGWNGTGAGELTIAGGYANCGDPRNDSNPVIGNGSTAVFDISGQSIITLINMQVFGSDSRGIIVDANSTLILEEVAVSGNVAGIRALGGSYVEVGAFSIIDNNGDLIDISKGGGIWCFGNNTEVRIEGSVANNKAQSGGNVYVEDGCFVELVGGSQISGSRELAQMDAISGGGIMVHDGGELFSNGGASRVFITDHWADFGGGLYVWGTGRATLLNTFIGRNTGFEKGSGLYAINGGSGATQVTMDRAASCPFLISCSEFDQNQFEQGVVFVNNSKIKIQRTLFDSNFYLAPDDAFRGMIEVENNAVLEMSYSNMINNNAYFLLVNYGQVEMSHITAVDNAYDNSNIGAGDAFVWYSPFGNTRIENSIWQDTQGGDTRGSAVVSGKCNLIDNSNDWPVGSYTTGTAEFINVAGGDSRQLSSSDGVDMCQADTFAWSTDRDIEYQVSPVNENTNPQGDPGEAGGLYDAGFDEVYDNIGEDHFLLTVVKEGSGSGSVVSTPVGIACGTDCTEVYFNGTSVTLFPNASAGSEFIGWRSCPLVNGSNQCLISVTESTTVFAEFQPDDLIFSDDFE